MSGHGHEHGGHGGHGHEGGGKGVFLTFFEGLFNEMAENVPHKPQGGGGHGGGHHGGDHGHH